MAAHEPIRDRLSQRWRADRRGIIRETLWQRRRRAHRARAAVSDVAAHRSVQVDRALVGLATTSAASARSRSNGYGCNVRRRGSTRTQGARKRCKAQRLYRRRLRVLAAEQPASVRHDWNGRHRRCCGASRSIARAAFFGDIARGGSPRDSSPRTGRGNGSVRRACIVAPAAPANPAAALSPGACSTAAHCLATRHLSRRLRFRATHGFSACSREAGDRGHALFRCRPVRGSSRPARKSPRGQRLPPCGPTSIDVRESAGLRSIALRAAPLKGMTAATASKATSALRCVRATRRIYKRPGRRAQHRASSAA